MQTKAMNKRLGSLTHEFNKLMNAMGVWFVVILFFVILSLTTDTFLSYANLINVIRQICVNAMVALGASYVILGGEIDLSTGNMCAFAGCGAALLMVAGVNMWLAIAIILVVGAIIGCLTGAVVTFIKIPSFIASLGMSYVILGANLLLTNSEPISGLPAQFMTLGRGYIADVIPVPVIILIIFFTIGAFFLKYTSFGRSVISVGENPIAARLSGIDILTTKVLIFAIGGFTAAAAGVVLASRLSSGQPMAGGDIGLTAIAAVFVGGTEKGSALNVLAGAFVLGLVNNGLNLLEVNAYWQKVALGLIIVLAVLLDQIRASRAVSIKK
ncbi:MAG TPA: ABC transporter permease [Anaerolineaceae bacterium]|nr:ABC transporter permease [Anaerolineaceae bacterium]